MSGAAQVGRYLVVCLVFALGLMAKARLVPVPIVLMLLDYWPLGRFGAAEPAQPVTSYAAADRSRRFPWRLVAEKIPLLALAIGASAIEMSMHAEVHDPLTLGQKVGNALVACVSYLGQFVYPVGLVAFYQHPGATLPLWKPLCAWCCSRRSPRRRSCAPPLSVRLCRLVLVSGDGRSHVGTRHAAAPTPRRTGTPIYLRSD